MPEARKTSGVTGALKHAFDQLRAYALTFPGVREDFPWGHSAFKVKEKAFLFLATEGGELSLSVKLPASATMALMLPFAAPTGYGLGRSGWVTATFRRGDDVAPKRVVAAMAPAGEASPAQARAKTAPAPKPSARKKTAARKR
jgi:predicted DNA-binding protein (MmcQ/YjbR family)